MKLTFAEICAIVGIPSIISFIIQTIITKIQEKRNAKKDNDSCLKKGVQALLRNNLLNQHDTYIKKGYISIADKENYDNMYKCYHDLGKNGVMDNCYKEIMSLPTEKIIKKKEK